MVTTLRRLLFAFLLAIVAGFVTISVSKADSFQAGQSGAQEAPSSVVLWHYDEAPTFSFGDVTQVGASISSAGLAVTPSNAVWGNTPLLAGTVAADTTAGLAEGGDHLVLGLENAGTQDLADQIGGRTLIGQLGYEQGVTDAVANSATRLSVNLNGLDGEGAYSQVMTAVQRGIQGNGATNWELLQVYQAGRMGEVTFYSNGATIGNPFG